MQRFAKLFLVVALLAGSMFGFSPDAAAHMNTNSVADVTGTVTWPDGPTVTTADFALPDGGNGCPAAGLDGVPGLHQTDVDTPPDGESSPDTCFLFTSLVIQTAGSWNGAVHQTDLGCDSSGMGGAAGVNANPGALGATSGVFECDVAGGAAPLPAGAANGHFHLLSKGSTIAFKGEVAQCNVLPCDPDPDAGGPLGRYGSGGGPSAIAHTVSCEGEVVPNPATLTDESGDTVPDTVQDAQVALECVIA